MPLNRGWDSISQDIYANVVTTLKPNVRRNSYVVSAQFLRLSNCYFGYDKYVNKIAIFVWVFFFCGPLLRFIKG